MKDLKKRELFGSLIFACLMVLLFYGFSRAEIRMETYKSKIILVAKFGPGAGEIGFAGNGPYYDSPGAFTVDPNGNIFIEDSLKHQIHKFDNNGKYLLSFGQLGKKEGMFGQEIYDIDIDGKGNIFVNDLNNARIQKFNNGGKYLLSFQTMAADRGGQKPIFRLEKLRVTNSGRVYALDRETEGWQVFDEKGNYLEKHEFNAKTGGGTIFEDANGDLYKTFWHKGRTAAIKKYKYSKIKNKHLVGQPDKEYTVDLGDKSKYSSEYLGFDGDQNIYVLFHTGRIPNTKKAIYSIDKFNLMGEKVAEINLVPLEYLWGGVRKFVLDIHGNIYQMNQNLAGIQIIKYSKEE